MTVYESYPTQFPVRPDDIVPLVVGYKYKLKPNTGNQWVVMVAIDSKNVYVEGVGNHKMPRTEVPRWKFDDQVAEYTET